MMIERTPRILWPDLIRVISVFLVILIHVSSLLLNAWDDLSFSDWMAGNIYDSLARVCVPLLFMISGYLLLSRQESIRSFYINRVRKVVIPLLVWSVIYLLWRNDYSSYTFVNGIKAIIYAILNQPAFFHLWFLYALLSIYLFVPLMRVFVHSANEETLWYFVFVWFIFGPLLDTVERFFGLDIAIDLGFVTRYIGYFYLGYILGRLSFTKWIVIIAAVVFVTSSTYTVIATYQASAANGDYIDFYHIYLSVNVVFMSLSAFILLKTLGEKIDTQANTVLITWIRAMSDASFGIYLIHAMILTFLRKGDFGFELSGFSGPAFIAVPSTVMAAFLISWIVVVILQKIPFLRVIVPR
ncbi:MAG: acyltransferase family protein [Anaerolineales bacterium]|nr:acyltransferase family protein [Anaerolineales bacterium]